MCALEIAARNCSPREMFMAAQERIEMLLNWSVPTSPEVPAEGEGEAPVEQDRKEAKEKEGLDTFDPERELLGLIRLFRIGECS